MYYNVGDMNTFVFIVVIWLYVIYHYMIYIYIYQYSDNMYITVVLYVLGDIYLHMLYALFICTLHSSVYSTSRWSHLLMGKGHSNLW